MGDSFNMVFDIIEVCAGLYILYSAVSMNRTGTITGSGLIGKDINIMAAHDVPGFIKKMSPIYYICGTLFLLLGGASLYMDYSGITNSTVGLAITAILLATCVVFAWQTKAAQDKYLK